MEKEQVPSIDAGKLKKLELKYDVKNDNYVGFIGEFRDKARDGDKLCHGLPILPLEADANPPYIGVNLQVGGVAKGVAMIRRFDLRLIYFQNVSGQMVYVDDFELYDKNSRLLDFGIDDLVLGLVVIVEAVDFLANCSKVKNTDVGTPFLVRCNQKRLTDSSQQKVSLSIRTSLALLCLVLCEATKLDFLSNLFGNAFETGRGVPLTSWLLHRINDWESFSHEFLLEDHEDTGCNYYLPASYNDWHDGKRVIGVTCQDIAQFLGILRAFPQHDLMPLDTLPGTCLLEVYSVRVYINGGRSANVYGSIRIDNGSGTFYIYDRDRSKCEFVESHGVLSLQVPASPIALGTSFDMVVDIMEEGGDNLGICKGKLRWDSSLGEYLYESLSCTLVRGKNGYVIVNYSVFKNAIQAEFKATLMKKGSFVYDRICLHGELTTRYDNFDYVPGFHKKYFQTTLFGKPFMHKEFPWASEPCKQGTEAEEGEDLNLARSRVTVPVDSTLIFKADLKGFKGNKIVTGSIEIAPTKFGKFAEYLGCYGDTYELYVSWEWKEMDSVLKEE